jgi:hypothetical protein
MKFKISPQKKGNDYPTKSEYYSHSHKLIKSLLSIGIGSALVVSNLAADDKSKLEEESNEKKAKSKEKAESISEKITRLASALGAEDFKVRQTATIALIELGKKEKVDKEQPFKAIIIKEMAKLAKHDDPEIRVRAKQVLSTFNTTRKKTPNHLLQFDALCTRHCAMPVNFAPQVQLRIDQ